VFTDGACAEAFNGTAKVKNGSHILKALIESEFEASDEGSIKNLGDVI
jgi:hypothetical protein